MKWMLASLIALAVSLGVFSGTVLAATNPFEGACSAPGAGQSAACQAGTGDPLTGPSGAITKATQIISYLAGMAAIILLLIGSVMYGLSGGDPSKASSAKSTIFYALIGLVIVVIAQGIVLFVLNKI